MKKFLIAFGIFLVLLIAGLFAVPYLFKDDILQAVKKDLNKNFTAQIDFEDVQISIFKTFPDLYFSLEKFSITGTGKNKDIPLALIDELGIGVDLVQLFKGEKKVKSIHLQNPEFVVFIDSSGNANYHIFKESGSPEDEDDEGLQMEIEKITVDHMRLLYEDQSMPMQMYVSGLDHTGKINIDGDTYTHYGHSTADTLHFIYDDVTYLKNVKAELDNRMRIKNDFSLYELEEMNARINRLPVVMDGEVELREEDIKMDLKFESAENTLAKFMSLVPDTYMPELPEMDIQGQAQLKGRIYGIKDEDNYPAYDIDFQVKNGKIKSKDLPESIDRIQLVTKVKFPGGPDLDRTEIDMPGIGFSLGGHRAEGYLHIKNPLTDPFVKTGFKTAGLALEKFKKALPMKSVKKLTGLLDADFDIATRISAMENQQYDKVNARGFLDLKNFFFASDSLPYPIQIPRAKTLITPAALQVENTEIKAGKSDFTLQGQITNYLSYALGKDSTLTARFESHSALIDFNELTRTFDDNSTAEENQEPVAPDIPAGLDIEVQAQADTMIYKKMQLSDVQSKLKIKDRKAELNTLVMKAFDGEIRLNGLYDASRENPFSQVKILMNRLTLDKSAQTLTYLKTYAPILKEIKGIFNMNLGLGVELDRYLNPILSTTDANGRFSSENLRPEHAAFFAKVADLLKINELKNPVIDKVQAQFNIDDGNMHIKPFDFKINRIQSQLAGKVNLDKSLDLTWDMEIPVEMFGERAEEWLNLFQGKLQAFGIPLDQIERVYVTLQITGSIDKPVIKPVFKKGAGKQGIVETVKETATQLANEKIEETKAQAKEKAKELIAEAEAKGDELIKKAEETAKRLKEEAEKQGQKLIEKADNPLAKLAAKKAAEKLVKEAEKKGNQLIEKAKQEKQRLIEEARKKAEEISKQ